MCKICEAMPLNQQYLSPFPKSDDIYTHMNMTDIKHITKTLIDSLVYKHKVQLAKEEFTRTGQTSLF